MEETKRGEDNMEQAVHNRQHQTSGNGIIFEIDRANTQKAIVKCSSEQLAQIISELKAQLTYAIPHKSEDLHNTIVHRDNQTDVDIVKKKLENYGQVYRQHYEPAPRIWVLYGLPLQATVEDVRDDLLSQGILVVSVLRLNVNFSDKKYKYPNLLVYLEDKAQESKLDKEHVCCKQPVTWKKLRGNVLRCYRCQTFNHSRPECTNKPRCINCAGEHSLQHCQKRNVENFRPKCCNCGKSHWADSPYCFVYQKNLLHIVNRCSLPKQIIFSLPLRMSPRTETDGSECAEVICWDWSTTDEENEDLLASLSLDEYLVQPYESIFN